MSKLKVHKIGDLCFDFKMGKDVDIDFYLKSEADKEIAEKDEELRHHKYKRCLAMGHRCQNAQYYFSVLQDNEASKINSNPKTFKELNRKCKFYARWRARWFMIADNFKEAK